MYLISRRHISVNRFHIQFFDSASRTYVAYDMLHMIWWNIKSKLWSGTIFCIAFNDIPIAEAFITSYHGSSSNSYGTMTYSLIWLWHWNSMPNAFFAATHKRKHMLNTITLSSKLFHSTLVILRSYAWEMPEPYPTFDSSESFNTFLVNTTRIFQTNIWIHTKSSLDLVNYNFDLPFEITFQSKNSTNNEPNNE